MIFIIIFNIILYAILLIWTWKNMYALENKTKVIYTCSIVICIYLVTKILYNVGGNPIGKELGDAAMTFNRTMVSLFVGINGLITMPHIGRLLNKYKEEIIDVNQLKKRFIIIGLIFIVLMIFEFNYIKDMQVNMLEIINQKGTLNE